jgi:hypothetical protein
MISLYLCLHEPEELNEVFKRLLGSCDILVVECAAREGHKKFEKYLNELSFRGRSDTHFVARRFPEFLERFAHMIANSKKRVEVERSPVSKADLRRRDAVLNEAWRYFLAGKLEEACELYLKGHKLTASFTKKRDVCMANQLVDLQRRDEESRILVLWGAAHMLYHLLRERVDVRQEFPYKPYTFSYALELVRRLLLGLSYDTSLVARVLVESMIYPYPMKLFYPGRECVKMLRRIVGKLSYGDMRELCEFASVGWRRRKDPRIRSMLWLKRRGLINELQL